MASIFSKIIAREIPAYIIAEDDDFIAILDAFPIQKGHCLVIPKKEIDKVYDMDNALLEKYLIFSKPIAKAIEKAFPCERVGLSFVGLEVPHAHLHLVPITNMEDMNFTREKLNLSTKEMQEIQEKIQSYLA
ncbi:MAG TPA: HIT family protein [Chitinophagaceae bacterium]|nr:HIT family protein [Chitinophagaceae bacterium]